MREDGGGKSTYFPLYRHFSPLLSSFSAISSSTATMTSALFVRKLTMGNDPASGPVEIGVSDADVDEATEFNTNGCLERCRRRPLHVAGQPVSMSELPSGGQLVMRCVLLPEAVSHTITSQRFHEMRQTLTTHFKSPYSAKSGSAGDPGSQMLIFTLKMTRLLPRRWS